MRASDEGDDAVARDKLVLQHLRDAAPVREEPGLDDDVRAALAEDGVDFVGNVREAGGGARDEDAGLAGHGREVAVLRAGGKRALAMYSRHRLAEFIEQVRTAYEMAVWTSAVAECVDLVMRSVFPADLARAFGSADLRIGSLP